MTRKISIHSCFLVNRQSIIFYSPDLLDILTIPLTSEVIQDLEIVNEAALNRVIKNWMRQSQIIPKTTAVYFVEETYFFKDVTQVPVTTQEPEVLAFVETVPFSHVITKIFPMNNGARIVAINRDLLLPINSVLEGNGFTVLAVAPDFAIGINKETPFSKEVAQQSLLDSTQLVLATNFLDNAQIEQKLEREKSFFSVQMNKKLILMIAVFTILLVVMITLLIFQNASQA